VSKSGVGSTRIIGGISKARLTRTKAKTKTTEVAGLKNDTSRRWIVCVTRRVRAGTTLVRNGYVEISATALQDMIEDLLLVCYEQVSDPSVCKNGLAEIVSMNKSNLEKSANLAAAYVRMSTEHQQYSTSNQMDVIREYAKRRNLEIVREYSDEGKSGLNIQGRDSLAQMIKDVESGAAGFTNILVYDVSRWGRFQDADESAYYEYLCRRAGVSVHYCAEQFENDGRATARYGRGTIGPSISESIGTNG